MAILPKIVRNNDQMRRYKIKQKILRTSAVMGGQLFGPIPKGHQREFFCLDRHSWVWHESWNDQTGHHSITTRYDVRPNGVFKVQNGGHYQGISPDEAKHLMRAAEIYRDKVVTNYNNSLQTA